MALKYQVTFEWPGEPAKTVQVYADGVAQALERGSTIVEWTSETEELEEERDVLIKLIAGQNTHLAI